MGTSNENTRIFLTFWHNLTSRRRAGWLFLLVALVALLLAVHARRPQAVAAPPADSPAYGVNFISYPNSTPMSATRYANGRSTGATWNRWPIYWYDVEQWSATPPVFHWAYQDTVVINDIVNGWQVNAILLGTPGFYTTQPADSRLVVPDVRGERPLRVDAVQAATPLGLYEPVFSDGSNTPGPGKQINDGNKWARFVFAAVNRYRPGGVLAQQEGWGSGVGITHWEMWNEPDLASFWDGTTADYAQLLKVGYLAAKQADPQAQILFGGLANDSHNITFYNDVMAIYDNDPQAAAHDYFHDVVATHNYLYAWESWLHVWRAGNTLAARGLEKPIWLNETGVPVWNDYPGPICEPDSPYRATMSEQANFVIQSALFATYAGADNLFFFQLYDDCGNQPGGTSFDYYPPEACTGDPQQDPGGDAFGLFRNATNGGCYWDHPQPETARPSLQAMQLLTTHFTGVEPLWRLRPGSSDPINGPQEWLAFFKAATGERVLGLWARFGQAQTAVVPTTNGAGQGRLLHPDGTVETITAVDGHFSIPLPPATNQNAIWDPTLYPIGGRPFLLLEVDDVPPQLTVTAPSLASAQIELSWQGTDLGSGVTGYDVSVAVDGGLSQPWLVGTTAVTAVYDAQPGHTYTFSVVARDGAGNVSDAKIAVVQTLALDEQVFLPLILK